MRAREIRKLIGTDTLVDVRACGYQWIDTGKVFHEFPDGYFKVCGNDFVRNALPRDIRLHVPAKKAPEVGSAEWADGIKCRRIRGDIMDPGAFMYQSNDEWWFCHPKIFRGGGGRIRTVKPSEQSSSKWSIYREPAAEQPKPAPTFNVGDVVDCDGPTQNTPMDVCKKGMVTIDWNDGEFSVDGEWESGADCRVIAGRFMRHHVAKEEAKVVQRAQCSQQGNDHVVRARDFLYNVAKMLEEKNAQYGDSASNPLRIFSKCDANEGLRVRIDDKLSRIARGNGQGGEDTIKDLVGYLALLATGKGKIK